MFEIFLRTDLKTPLIALLLILLGGSHIACAQEAKRKPSNIIGVPFVENAEEITVNGQHYKLWGIEGLMPDQRCYQGDHSWACGRQAIIALQHFVEGKIVECHVKDADAPKEGHPHAQCFCRKRQSKKDIARHMLRKGWAVHAANKTSEDYKNIEARARKEHRGIWSGRFQSPQNWKDGIQEFMNEE